MVVEGDPPRDDPAVHAVAVEVAPLLDGTIALRNSNHPEAGTVFFTRTEMRAWIKGCKAGEFDDLS